jgi:hypothetical protein
MSVLEGNPFINWKYFNINHNGKIFRFKVKAVESSLCDKGIAYCLVIKDKTLLIGSVQGKWYQLNHELPFAKTAGKEIADHVRKIRERDMAAQRERDKEIRKKSGGWNQNNPI